MTSEEITRLTALRSAWCPATLIRDLYGLDLQPEGRLRNYFLKSTDPEIIRVAVGESGETLEVHRFRFETLLQSNRLMPRKWLAAKIGMTEDSFCEMMVRLNEENLLYKFYTVPKLVERSFDNDLIEMFPELRFRNFGSHNSFCKVIHELLANRLNISIDPLYCVTSQALHEDPVDFAQVFDCLSLSPVGMKYKVWLDFRKPMNLAPDYCSMLLYAKAQAALDPFLAGTQKPEIPPELLSFIG